jgi:hypothetical protein
MRAFLLVAAAAFLSAPAHAQERPQCEAGKGYGAADISYQVDDTFLKGIKSIGISTVIRYYDWPDETLPGKTLTRHELGLIRKHKLHLAVVFQHHNDTMQTFETAGRGTTDARRTLALAKTFKQPRRSAIYFGVDGVDAKFLGEFKKGNRPEDDKFGISLIKRYFEEINAVFKGRKAAYAIGVYGSGLVCREILDARLARYCWLANAKSWPEYTAFEATTRWGLKQLLPTNDCFGAETDLNIVSPRSSKFGQWKP